MKMIRFLTPALASGILLSGFVSMPASAQRTDKVLTIFGSDKCPTSNGDEIVICRRLPEEERYRIPKDLRATGERGNETWGDRAASIEYVGRSGANSCSPAGAGGATGCFREMARKACAEDKADGKKCGVKF